MTAPHPAATRRSEDLELLGREAEQNTSTPSPRPADAAAFTDMFASEIEA
ncbi:MAG TPA: hypothetical protein VJ370_22760 [Streptosporangiaceae bacterium]|nr:hypothetical protein [Streptosporangiaceae bacterium]